MTPPSSDDAPVTPPSPVLWARLSAALLALALLGTLAALVIGWRGGAPGVAWAPFMLGAGVAPAYGAHFVAGYAAALSGNARWQSGLLLHRPSFLRWMRTPDARQVVGDAPVRLFWRCCTGGALALLVTLIGVNV